MKITKKERNGLDVPPVIHINQANRLHEIKLCDLIEITIFFIHFYAQKHDLRV